MPPDQYRGVSRRDFVRTAVAIGGSSALAACLDRERSAPESGHETDRPNFPRGGSPTDLPRRQHAWNEYLVRNVHGNTLPPAHQIVLGLRYEGSTPPSAAEREKVETALHSLERAFQWGTSGRSGASINDGLLLMLGYAPRYFDRLGTSVDVTSPDSLLDTLGEDPSSADPFDAMLILNSDYGSIVLAAEAALFGEIETVNGLEMEGTFEDVFSKVERRSGVVGKGLPAKRLENDDIPDDAPLSMGFRSSFLDNQAPEDQVTIRDGPFAGGTTLQVSRLHIDLDRWYDQDTDERVAEMFCPAHNPDEVGETGDKLGSTSQISRDDVANIPEHAETYGRLGHSQKIASARDENFVPRILRRSEAVATDVSEGAGFNFSSVQRTIDAFADARAAMSPDEYDLDVADEDHGIVDYLETVARGTYLVPPRDRRALPVP